MWKFGFVFLKRMQNAVFAVVFANAHKKNWANSQSANKHFLIVWDMKKTFKWVAYFLH